MVNCEPKIFKKGEQVLYCYGKRSNGFLLLNYGFAILDNKYDSVAFPIRLAVKPENVLAIKDIFPSKSEL